MISAAWSWASSTNNLRINSVHKEEEARLILSDTFDLVDEEGIEVSMNGSIEMDDSWLIRGFRILQGSSQG